MKKAHLQIAYQLAPIVCQETAGSADERYQDYFCRVDYDGDRQANNNWDNLPRFFDKLVPEIYCAVLETETHYFALYSVFHPRDWKPIQGHENDMEHVQVVGRKTRSRPVVEYVCTNAHTWNSYYYNSELAATARFSEKDQERLFDGPIALHRGHPVIHVQPGTGDVVELLGCVGHGIHGVVARRGAPWKDKEARYDFSGGQGLVCMPDRTAAEAPDPRQPLQSGVPYCLIPTDETLWAWRTEVGASGLYSTRMSRWLADSETFRKKGEPLRARSAYFRSRAYGDEALFPEAFVGNEGVKDAAHPPFAFSVGVPWWIYLLLVGREPGWVARERRHNALIDQGLKPVNCFFDPAHAWFLRLGGPSEREWSTDYVGHTYLAGSPAAGGHEGTDRGKAPTRTLRAPVRSRRDSRSGRRNERTTRTPKRV